MQYTSKSEACRAAEGLLTQAGATEAEIVSVTTALANPAVKLDDFVALLDGPLAVKKLKGFAGNTPAGFTGWVRWGPLVLMVLVFCGMFVLQAVKYGPESLTLVFSSVLSGLLSALGIIAVLEKAYKLDWPFKYLATVLQAVGGVFRPARAAFSELSMVKKVLSVLIVILCVVVVVFAGVYGR